MKVDAGKASDIRQFICLCECCGFIDVWLHARGKILIITNNAPSISLLIGSKSIS